MMHWSKWLYLDYRHGHGDSDVPSTLCPARKYICPARLRGITPASGEIYFRAGQSARFASAPLRACPPSSRTISSTNIYYLLVSILSDDPRTPHTRQTPYRLKKIKHATSSLPLPSPIDRCRRRQNSATTRRTRSHPARWDVAQRSERGRWLEHVCRRSEDEDEFEG
jgi:hypothetical protein